MARARNIKPGFFTNDVLGELPALARLLFAGLWTLCDREGRLEDRPKKIKAEVLPYDECDADALLSMLADKGFILRYWVAGTRLIQVTNWSKHQNPHVKEAASSLPAPDEHGASTVQAPDETQPKPALAGLIPDSGFRIPSSLIPDSIEVPPTEVLVVEPSVPRPPECPTEALIALYHEHLPMLPRVEVVNDGRKRALSTRWREVVTDPDIRGSPDVRQAGIEWFAWFFSHAATSRFLTGRAKDWRADFDFLMTASRFAKVVEGRYHRGAA